MNEQKSVGGKYGTKVNGRRNRGRQDTRSIKSNSTKSE